MVKTAAAKWIWAVQALTVLFSLSGVLIKFASMAMEEYGFFSIPTLFFIACFCTTLAVYAFFWQKVIVHLPLSTAYFGKSLTVFWSLVWAWLLFGENISLLNITGAAVIAAGVIIMVRDEL